VAKSPTSAMSKPLLVMKFGGTSVGSPEAIRRAATLSAQATADHSVIVVSSAMAGVTDTLLGILESARGGDENAVEEGLTKLEGKHIATAAELLPADRHEPVALEIRQRLDKFGRIARGVAMLGQMPPASVDEAVPTGERLSNLLLSELLRSMGIATELVNGCDVIETNDQFGDATPMMDGAERRCAERLSPLLDDGVTPIVTGFEGSTSDGRATTLGRGGTDFSAAILGAALSASELWIWTDVDGIMTSDPRIVPDARVLSDVTYNEAAELAFNGAKVLHPRTLSPLVDKRIPVWIKNSFRPEVPGTKISSEVTELHGVRAISTLGKVTLITIEAVSLLRPAAQVIPRALGAVARANIEVLLLTRSSFRQNFCMLVRSSDVDAALEGLRDELALEIAHQYVHPIEVDDSVGLLASVGEGMRGSAGLAGQLFTAISEREINIIAIAQGSSELTIAVVVRQDDLNEAARAVHSACGLAQIEESVVVG